MGQTGIISQNPRPPRLLTGGVRVLPIFSLVVRRSEARFYLNGEIIERIPRYSAISDSNKLLMFFFSGWFDVHIEHSLICHIMILTSAQTKYKMSGWKCWQRERSQLTPSYYYFCAYIKGRVPRKHCSADNVIVATPTGRPYTIGLSWSGRVAIVIVATIRHRWGRLGPTGSQWMVNHLGQTRIRLKWRSLQ